MRPPAPPPSGGAGGPAEHRPWPEVPRALREARGITQEGWAARLGVSRKTFQGRGRGAIRCRAADGRGATARCAGTPQGGRR
jgi:hypothetical protein